VRIEADYGTPEFTAEYQAALTSAPHAAKEAQAAAGTLAWLIERYRETAAWQGLSLATRRQRENIFKQVMVTAADKPIARITTEVIEAGRDRRAKTTPFQARHEAHQGRSDRRCRQSEAEKERRLYGLQRIRCCRLSAALAAR
jgi:hypothetical protein